MVNINRVLKIKSIIYGFGVFIALGCSGTSSDSQSQRRNFYTPPNWKQPIVNNAKIITRETPKSDNKNQADDKAAQIPAPASMDKSQSKLILSPSEREQMDGYASWYGPNFHGKKTANGEIYDQNEMTAAHKILPMNTIVRVTSLENNQVIVVRINDRGPYKKNRIIDLTKKSTEMLGFLEQGTARVSLDVISFPKDFDHAKGLKPYKQVVVQLAAFSALDRAVRFKDQLQKKYTKIPFLIDTNNKGSFAVVAGPYDERSRAKEIASALKADGVEGFVRSYRK